MSREEYILFKTKLGLCGIAWHGSGKVKDCLTVTAFHLPETSDRLTADRIAAYMSAEEAHVIPSEINTIIKKVQQHLAGKAQDFRDIKIGLGNAGPFTKAVYTATRKIPAGQTMTYGELAKAIKHPKAARAVGQALARNPIPLIIPCHRVVAVGNRLGGYSCAGGIAAKSNLLVLEGAAVASKWLTIRNNPD